jgi:hypothetical protein
MWKQQNLIGKRRRGRKKVINQASSIPIFIVRYFLSMYLPFADASEGTDCVIENASSVGSAESGTAISIGQSLNVQELQSSGSRSRVAGLSPSRSNNVNTSTDET